MISFLKKLFNFGKSKEVIDPYSYCKDWGYKPAIIPFDLSKPLPKGWIPIERLETNDELCRVEDKVFHIEHLIKHLREQGFTQKQIAQQIGLTQNQVKSKLQKLINEGKIERKHVRTR